MRASGDNLFMNLRRPGEGPYARVERECRWTVARLPADARRTAEILDRYISGTRLRLRRLETAQGVTLKLGQKIRVEPTDPEVVKLTNIYLDGAEYDLLAGLPAAELRKTRWHARWEGVDVAIDEFHDRLEGLLLAEVELDPDDVRGTAPSFAVRDVTNEDRFSGGALAFASDDVLKSLIQEAGVAGRD